QSGEDRKNLSEKKKEGEHSRLLSHRRYPTDVALRIRDEDTDEQQLDRYVRHLRVSECGCYFIEEANMVMWVLSSDLEVLWESVKERFASSKPKNFSDDFLLTTLTYMFKKPDVQAQVWKNQRTIHGLAKVKSWKLLESYGMHIITFTSTQMILLVERRYPFTRFTLDQMLKNVRLEVEEQSEVSLELLRFVRQQQQEGFRPE
nr:hypothetical protein [Tanacetum cinerariifolium]